jgi:hypothetical protein
MPKIKRGKKPPPEGWEIIEPTLLDLEKQMREGKPPFSIPTHNLSQRKPWKTHKLSTFYCVQPRMNPMKASVR